MMWNIESCVLPDNKNDYMNNKINLPKKNTGKTFFIIGLHIVSILRIPTMKWDSSGIHKPKIRKLNDNK